MPYITPERRRHLNAWIDLKPGNAGELNYIISCLAIDFVNRKHLNYAVLAEVQAAIHGALVEFERRFVDPYEDCKRQENGDLAGADELTATLDAIADALA